jgi:hypothetical protein
MANSDFEIGIAGGNPAGLAKQARGIGRVVKLKIRSSA